jgi:CheY-like chemotaxis protein
LRSAQAPDRRASARSRVQARGRPCRARRDHRHRGRREGASGVEALRFVDELKPDVVVIDVATALMTGIEAARRMSESGATTEVLAL